MRKFLLIISVSLCLAGSVFGQIVTTISNVQDTTGTGNADSPLKDSVVTVIGVVSGESFAFDGKYYIQDGSGAWSGIYVYGDWDRDNAYGDSVRITATVNEYWGLTQLIDVTSYELLGSGKTVEPTLVTTGEIATDGSNAELFEGVLVKVVNVEITNDDLGYGEWEIDDGSGPFRVHDSAPYYFIPSNYDSVRSITGVLNYDYSDTKIEPRLAYDVVETGRFTRIQRIQQVRHSDLLKAPIDNVSDHSYLNGDTVTVKGIVTMPVGLSYAGAGVKFIFSDLAGGPWSGILSYDADSTAFPLLLEGDVIEATGYISEYNTGPSNMTELFVTSPIVFIDIGQPLPDPDKVNTGDLRIPATAEQWGTGIVYVNDAKVVNLTPAFELFSVDDGTGSIDVGADSDSLTGYLDPPMGSFADSIRGWIYHHYGLYSDSTTYKIEPLYTSDVVWGVGLPPELSNGQRIPEIPTSADAVKVSVDVTTDLSITTASLYYRVDSGDYSMIPMTGTEGTYEGQIPAQPLDSWVDYFISITDDKAQTVMVPSDTSILNLCYPVTDGNLSIKDLQYTSWGIADSPFEGMNVSVTGIVTTDTAAYNNFDTYVLQDAAGIWNGVFTFGIKDTLNTLSRGDEITVHGTVTDYNPDWGFKWDNNTVILVESFSRNSGGNSINVVDVTSGELNTDTTTAESYEGVVVKISNATLVGFNPYDAIFDDGSGPCLIDDDFTSGDFSINSDEGYIVAWGDTIRKGEIVKDIRGVFTFSFGTFKIEVRDSKDFGTITGINTDYQSVPLTYQLRQNYPNPFNPETRISFEIPQAQEVTLVIYNVLGQKVRTLVDESFNAGRHVINWNGLNDSESRVPTGMYFYRIKAGSFIETKKMLMVK